MLIKTVAILADTGEFPSALVEVLSYQNLQIIFVSKNEEKFLRLKEQFGHLKSTAEFDFISCEKEGCWEADMIVLSKPDEVSSLLLQKIREVAGQKIVLVLSEIKENTANSDAEKLLPNSKIVEVNISNNNFLVSSNNPEARPTIEKLFEASDYKINLLWK